MVYKKNIEIINYQGKQYYGTLYSPSTEKINALVLYIHGGGFIFGSRDNLPDEYLKLFKDNQIAILSVDYPLAPEHSLNQILNYFQLLLEWFNTYLANNFSTDNVYILGRSAGAYLALYMVVRLTRSENVFKGIISLYGYYNLTDPNFVVPNRHYLKYPEVSTAMIDKLIHQSDIQTSNRYAIYIHGRQKGKWLDLVLSNRADAKEFSLSKNDLLKAPPLYLAAASLDPDVPASQSKQIDEVHPNSHLRIIDSSVHDFDRTDVNTVGIPLYKSIIDWIKKLND